MICFIYVRRCSWVEFFGLGIAWLNFPQKKKTSDSVTIDTSSQLLGDPEREVARIV